MIDWRALKLRMRKKAEQHPSFFNLFIDVPVRRQGSRCGTGADIWFILLARAWSLSAESHSLNANSDNFLFSRNNLQGLQIAATIKYGGHVAVWLRQGGYKQLSTRFNMPDCVAVYLQSRAINNSLIILTRLIPSTVARQHAAKRSLAIPVSLPTIMIWSSLWDSCTTPSVTTISITKCHRTCRSRWYFGILVYRIAELQTRLEGEYVRLQK